MHCISDISKLIDKDMLSIEAKKLRNALLELPEDYIVAFKTCDCLLESVVRKHIKK